MASLSTTSLSFPPSSPGRAFLLGAMAGAAVGCCATAALLAAGSPSSSSSSRGSSSRRGRSSSSNVESATMGRSWLRQLLCWTDAGERVDALTLWGQVAKAGEQAAAADGDGCGAAAADAEEGAATFVSSTEAAAAQREEGDGEEKAAAATAAVSAEERGGGGELQAAAEGGRREPSKEKEGEGERNNQREGEFDASAAAEKGEACPGYGSQDAGRAAACAGCPNRGICSSSSGSSSSEAAQSSKEMIAAKLAGVKRKILILSGKGGVGKSTITAQLGWTAASRGLRVGILDVDVCGPSIPLMMHARQGEVHQSAEGWQPVYVHSNLAVMSIGFLLPDADAAIIWRGPKKNGLIHQFLADVLWGDLDLLLIDTPPGTSDEHLSIVSLLDVDGALVVTTPQEAALQDVRKEINFCFKTGVKVLGVVENMANSVFSLVDVDGAKKMCTQMKVPYAGSVPLDASLLRACEEGVPTVEKYPDQPGSEALQTLTSALLEMLALPQHREEDEDD